MSIRSGEFNIMINGSMRKIRRRFLWLARNIDDKACQAFSRHPQVPTYWSYSDNFGEWITAEIMKKTGVYPEYVEPSAAKVVSTGSILEHLPDTYAGIILGSGFINEETRRDFKQAQVWAVRGALSAERISSLGNRTPVLADPGLLASYLYPDIPEQKRFRVGIIPHYSDFKLRYDGPLRTLLKRYPSECTVIDVQQSPSAVFRSMARCDCILASSLHGLIVADSFGIPNRWIEFSRLHGGRFKFHDYYSSLGITSEPLVDLSGEEELSELIAETSVRATPAIESAKEQLMGLFLKVLEEAKPGKNGA